MADDTTSTSGMVAGLLRSIGTLLGVHIQYAQQEASSDLGRVIGGVILCVAGSLFAALALVLGHAAGVWALHGQLGWLRSLLVVGAGDLVLALLLLLVGRSRLRRPVLKQTRMLLRKTVTSMTRL